MALIILRYVNGDDASLMSCVGRMADVLMHANTPQINADMSTGLDTFLMSVCDPRASLLEVKFTFLLLTAGIIDLLDSNGWL